MSDQDEPERLEMGQERMLPVDNMVAAKHHRRRRRVLKHAVQCQALQVVCMGDARDDDVRDARVDEVEVREVLDRDGLEGKVPRVLPLEVRAEDEVPQRLLIVVEHLAHLAHVRPAVVIFCAQCELAQVAELGNALGVEVPPASSRISGLN